MRTFSNLYLLFGITLLFPSVALADDSGSLVQGDAGGFGTFAGGLMTLINQYLIPLFIAIAVLAFIWGVTKYFILNSDNEESRDDGKMLMLYAIIGFVAIVALWGIVNFVAESIGVSPGDTLDGYPVGPGSSDSGSSGGDDSSGFGGIMI